MNNKVAIAASFLLGAGAGFGGCYIFLKKKLEKDSEVEIKQFKQDYISAKESSSSSSKKEEKINESPQINVNDISQLNNTDEIPHLDYAGFFESEEDYDDVHEEFAAELESPQDDEPEINNEPYIVKDEDLEDELMQDSIQVTYFMEDGVLMEDLNNMTVDISEAFGEKILKKIIEGTQNNIYDIFVRNPRNDSIYEVTIDDGSYKDYMNDFHGGL